MSLIVGVLSDLMFTSRIREVAEASGLEVRFVRSAADLESLNGLKIQKVIVDLNLTKIDPFQAISSIRALDANLPIVGFFSHVDVELKDKAISLGVTEVMPRSHFVRVLSELMSSNSL